MPLAIEQIRGYAEFFKIRSIDEREDIFTFVGVLDEVYMEVANTQRAEADKPK